MATARAWIGCGKLADLLCGWTIWNNLNNSNDPCGQSGPQRSHPHWIPFNCSGLNSCGTCTWAQWPTNLTSQLRLAARRACVWLVEHLDLDRSYRSWAPFSFSTTDCPPWVLINHSATFLGTMAKWFWSCLLPFVYSCRYQTGWTNQRENR